MKYRIKFEVTFSGDREVSRVCWVQRRISFLCFFWWLDVTDELKTREKAIEELKTRFALPVREEATFYKFI
jgi:hypothetical protein